MLLLSTRLAILPFFIAAVVHVIRHFIPGDWRMAGAAGWAVAASLCGATAILLDSGMPQDPAAAGFLGVKLFGMLLLAGVLWVAIYAGQLLGDRQGGYWMKTDCHTRQVVWWSIGVALALLAYNWTVFHLLAFSTSPAPSGQSALSRLLTHVAFSLGEEFFYRGCVQALLVAWFARFRGGRGWAVVLATVLFTVQHTVPLSHLALFVFPGGLLFGILFLRFGMCAAVAAHVAANLMMTFILPRLVL